MPLTQASLITTALTRRFGMARCGSAGLGPAGLSLALGMLFVDSAPAQAEAAPAPGRSSVYPELPAGLPPARPLEPADAARVEDMQTYSEPIPGSAVSFTMVPIPGGAFVMGSPDDEKDRSDDEGPAHEVRVDPFWMGQHEVTWNEYHIFMFKLDQELRLVDPSATTVQDSWADAISRPTPPYVPMDFEMGVDGYPAICMTQFAARQYTRWLSMKTGRFYRLPTEAEWEFACRAGTTTRYSFGDDASALGDHAWYFDNSDDRYQKVGGKLPNAFGLYDMHGNVWEWVLDGYSKEFYAASHGATAHNPIAWPTDLYPRCVRGGSWDADPEDLRSAARRPSRPGWKIQDPQLPKSIWYHTNATDVGFRVVRPLHAPPEAEWLRYWEADVDEVREIQSKQRQGGR